MSLPTEYQEFIALSRYARWLPEEGRRETWDETVDRYVTFFANRTSGQLDDVLEHVRKSIYNLDVMPSMRALMTAGEALDRDNVAGFNCSYVAVNRQRSFDEIMYVLMCGTGVGFSCERQEVAQLPTVAEEMYESDSIINVRDSKIGWASAFRELISLLYAGKIPKWDLSKIRPSGAPLKTFGGRASGPEPLDDLFKYSVALFMGATGRKLNSIEVHGLVCKIAEIVVVGGVRRSALISLSNLSDDRMRHAKSGQWWVEHPEFSLANNSACYTEKPNAETFLREWTALLESKSGERGIFNREASQKQAEKNGRRDASFAFGTNPCSEIILRDRQFCNLSEIVVRAEDTFETLKEKVKVAAILGTLQATLTDFRYLSKKWRDNTAEEALLGVSLTGIMDHPVLSGELTVDDFGWDDFESEGNYHTLREVLEELKNVAIETNKEWAEKLGINPSTAITAVKPSGTVSQLVDSASGIHPRYSEYYIRTVRADKKDPLAQYMIDAGFPVEEDAMKPESTLVFSFPMKAPENAVFRNDRSAIQQLEHWLTYQRHWCEHKPSVTIYYKDEEAVEVGAWVHKHFDEISGISFLPHSDHTYKQAPYQEISKDEYERFLEEMPKDVDWSKLGEYEDSDNTEGSQTMACVGGACEIVDLGGSS
jgi:ribonucleoside-triphosphate reductase